MINALEIYRIISGQPVVVTSITSDDAYLANAIMGKNEISVSLVSDFIPDILEGDYIVWDNIKYRLNREPEFVDKSIQHDTTFVFEAPEYTLIDKILTNKITGSTKVTLLGKLRDWIELLVWNVNKTPNNPLGIDTGWQIGTIPDTDYMTLTFDGIDCRTLLSELASAYGFEYYVDNKTINYISRIENERGLSFTQGRGKGLYEIEQNNIDSGDITTRIYPVGGTENIIPGEGDEDGRLILPEKYIENFSETSRVVENKVVFEGVHPTFTGKVENPSGENNREFICSTIDFNIDDLSIGDEARVNFLTGDLMGKSFEFKWSNDEKKITLLYQEDNLAVIDPETQTHPTIPSDAKYLRGNEEFNFTGIRLGEAYKNAAVTKLREKAIDWLNFHSQKRVKFTLSVDHRYMRGKGDLKPGDLITITIPDRNLSKLIRISSTEKNLKTGKITCVVSNYLIEKWENKIEGVISSIQSIINGGNGSGNVNISLIEQFDERPLTDKNALSSLRALKEIADRAISKTKPDETNFLIKFLAGLEAGEFKQGSTGVGIYQDKDGNWHIETDYLDVRMKFTAKEVEIQKVFHIGGAQVKTSAAMKCIRVEELEDVYRCYMNTTDEDGQVIYNQFKVNDQAYVQTFNLEKQADGTLGNHFFWRLVTEVGPDYIDLSKEICALASDAPKAFDDIVQLGYRGTDDATRQVAVIDAGAGEGAPYYRQYVGINSFHLPKPETQLKPGENEFTGKVHIEPGSTGFENIGGLEFGKVNLLRNSGFTGDYNSAKLEEDTELEEETDLYSQALKFWAATNVVVNSDTVSQSGRSVTLNTGILVQTLYYKMIEGEKYIISFKAKGSSVSISCGGFEVTEQLTSAYQKYVYKFTAAPDTEFTVSGTCTICELQLERGTVPSEWSLSPLDNNSLAAKFEAIRYLTDVIREGSTTFIGGLGLLSMILVGNYVDGEMKQVTGGLSGVYNDGDDPLLWGDGNLEKAMRTVLACKDNPMAFLDMTEEELANYAKIVLTHGGRAILNDVILRGYVYALGGIFKGKVEIAGGKILLNEDGSGQLADGSLYWDATGTLYRKSREIIVWRNIAKEMSDAGITEVYNIDLKKGTFLRTFGDSSIFINLPAPSLYPDLVLDIYYPIATTRIPIPNFTIKCDASAILKYNSEIKSYEEVYIGAPIERDGSITCTEVDGVLRWVASGNLEVVTFNS